MQIFPEEVPYRTNEPLAKHTSYRIGGAAKIFALPKSKEHLFCIGNYLLKSKEPYFFLGNGSNVLAPDEGFPGVVICTKELDEFINFLDHEQVEVSASTLNARLLRACAERGLGGLEALSGVPGNLGGTIFMNAGTADGWIEEILDSVKVINLCGGERAVKKVDLAYSYREQHYLKSGELIYSAILKLKKGEPDQIKAKLVKLLKKRKLAQPIELPSCGSVFRNPEGMSAWSCIDKVGLRGFSRGGARISQKHCNFIVNEGGARRGDILYLIQYAKEKVSNTLGISLHEEVVLMETKFLS